jgi:hypothetical protein
MPRLQFFCALAILPIFFSLIANAQVDVSWPTDDEINLARTQTDRALERYKLLLDEQEMQIGKSATNQVAEDRRLVSDMESAMKTLKARPQTFNGPAGFTFYESLAATERSVLQCGVNASSQSAGYVTAAKPDKADALFHLSQSCMDLSTLIYTISEQVGSLYKRYIEAQDKLAARNAQDARQCADALDKSKPRKLGPAF